MNRRPGRPGATFEPVDPPPSAEDLCADGSMSLKEAARFLSVSLGCVEGLVRRKEVLSFKIGRRRVVPRRGLVLFQAKLLAAQQPGATIFGAGDSGRPCAVATPEPLRR
jgi:hypothetical protein